ncbi:MAG TPA: ATP-grasp domain-containing protein [Isosphaeraceae bacterium]|nr:ATP-grasp domain-containing protein [Isosphaeraceae bacterium]
MPHDVLILGASARAAAFSALRSGLRPYCADYFADRDLAAACPVHRVDPAHAARDFLAIAEALPPSPWFYTGGLENHPELVERIRRRHRLWGVGAGVLRAVRDPIRVARVLNEAGIPVPEARRDGRGLPRDGSWLVKPMASGGGRGIAPLTGSASPDSAADYVQRRIDGPSFSALFLGRGDRARLVGVTRQWTGIAGAPFAYRGSLGPWSIGPDLAGRLRTLGDRLTAAFGLVGWFGVDYILADGLPWPVEVNPRYPASLELHELASGCSLLEQHRRACEGGDGEDPLPQEPGVPRPPVLAKRILYATRRSIVPEIALDGPDHGHGFAVPAISDVPQPGSRLEPGEPAMTVWATAAEPAACRARSIRLERSWRNRLGWPTPMAHGAL